MITPHAAAAISMAFLLGLIALTSLSVIIRLAKRRADERDSRQAPDFAKLIKGHTQKRFEKEPEIKGIDGTVRKAHYGDGRQPWDDIKDLGWAPAFAAGNALKYVRRFAKKNGADDLEKGIWYYRELVKMAQEWMQKNKAKKGPATICLQQLRDELTHDELVLLGETQVRCAACSAKGKLFSGCKFIENPKTPAEIANNTACAFQPAQEF